MASHDRAARGGAVRGAAARAAARPALGGQAPGERGDRARSSASWASSTRGATRCSGCSSGRCSCGTCTARSRCCAGARGPGRTCARGSRRSARSRRWRAWRASPSSTPTSRGPSWRRSRVLDARDRWGTRSCRTTGAWATTCSCPRPGRALVVTGLEHVGQEHAAARHWASTPSSRTPGRRSARAARASARRAIGTSMRIEDSLEQGVSHFYAELRRLKRVLDLALRAAGRPPVLFLLDEILHGTNSRERVLGACAVVRELVDRARSGPYPRTTSVSRRSSRELGRPRRERALRGAGARRAR